MFKICTSFKNFTAIVMVYGETGRFPLYISVYCRIISYWAKLSSGPENKIVYFLYKYLYNLHCNRLLTNSWLDGIQKIFNTSGAPNTCIRHEQGQNIIVKWITSIIKQTLKDQFIQKWCSDVNNSSKGQMYRICKQKKMGDFIEPGTHRSTNIKVKIETL